MKLGALLIPTSSPPQTADVVELARRLEDQGYESLWAAQAVGRGFLLPDPLLVLAAVAPVTGLPLGTAILQTALYEPPALAHALFSLRYLTGDRLRLGVGAGSTAQDFQVHGRDFGARFRDFRSSLTRLRALLATGREEEIDLSPYPALLPGPPLLLGSWGQGVVSAATEFDGWIASALHRSAAQIREALGIYREHGGRQAIVSAITLGKEETPGEQRRLLEEFAAMGVDEAVVTFRPGGPSPERVRDWVPR